MMRQILLLKEFFLALRITDKCTIKAFLEQVALAKALTNSKKKNDLLLKKECTVNRPPSRYVESK